MTSSGRPPPPGATSVDDGTAQRPRGRFARLTAASPHRPHSGTIQPSLTATVGALLVAVGAGLRLDQYLSGRSLWLDESFLALNIIDRSITGLSHQLDFNQGAPLGFLVTVKVLVLAFGKSEAVLRLLPLLCGIASLPLVYVVARRVTAGIAVVIAMVLVAGAPGLVYYSAELKQYSCDVLAGTVLLAVSITNTRPTPRRYAAVAVTAAITIWFSHATVFFVGAIAAAYGLELILDRAWRRLAQMAGLSLIWAASFAAFYLISYRDLVRLQSTLNTDTGLTQSSSVVELAGNVGGAIGLPLGQGGLPELVRPLAIAVAVLGFLVLLRQQRQAALILGLPGVFVVFAAAVHKYPTTERALIFVVPLIAILGGHGIVSIARLRGYGSVPAVVAAGLLVVVAAYPVAKAAGTAVHPRKREETKPLLRILYDRWRPGDALYVHYGAAYAFRYYAECRCVGRPTDRPPLSFGRRGTQGPMLFSPAVRSDPPRFIAGLYARHRFAVYEHQLDTFRGQPRVWILYSHSNGPEERRFLRVRLPRYLARIARLRARHGREHAGLLLYDFRKRSG